MHKGFFDSPPLNSIKRLIGLQTLIFNRLKPFEFSHQCYLCRESSNQRLCSSCQLQFLTCPQHQCHRCGLSLKKSALLCGECLKHPPVFDGTFSPFIYQSPLSDMLTDFKQRHQLFAGKALSDLFAQKIDQHYRQQHLSLPDFILPVPLHWKKQLQRGFNQTNFFSQSISKQLSIPIFKHCKRIKAAQDQKGLNKKERLKNLRHSFEMTHPLYGANIAIVDDVMTTGATVNALAEELKEGGAEHVTIWVLARTPK